MSNRRYDSQFKAEVISLALSSDIPRTQLAIDLGVNYKTLCTDGFMPGYYNRAIRYHLKECAEE